MNAKTDTKLENLKLSLKISIIKMKEKRALILICCISIIVLTFVFFSLTFEKQNEEMVQKYKGALKTNPHIKRELSPLPTCKEIKNEIYNYTIADHYISSSFNSALIGNQKKDYLSLEFFEEVLKTGARYIELQINPSTTEEFPEPIVGTGELNNNWGNSINNLKLSDVFKAIRIHSFNTTTNYPLIIYIDFNSRNSFLIKRVGELIESYLPKYALKTHNYHKNPFTVESMCKFNNKIIFLSSLPDNFVIESTFKNYNMPTLGFVKRIHASDIQQYISKTYNDVENQENEENEDTSRIVSNSLSSKQLDAEDTKFYNTFKTIEDILESVKPGFSFYDKLIELKFKNPLLYFNKVGITIIIPHNKEDIFTLNYEPNLYWDNGCQICAMNFQESIDKNIMSSLESPTKVLSQNTPIIIRYLSKFVKNSFILKEEYYRFIPKETPINKNKIFIPEQQEKTNLKIINNLYENYKNQVVAIQSYSNPGYYVNTNSGNINFSLDDTPKNNNLYMFFQSSNDIFKNKGAICISAVNDLIPFNYRNRRFLSEQDDNFILRYIPSISNKLIVTSTFFPVNPSCDELSTSDSIQTFSFRNTEEYDPPYIGYENKILTKYFDSDSTSMKNSCCFNIIKQKVKLFIYFKHLHSNLYLTCLNSGRCIYKNKTPLASSKFEIINNNQDINELSYLKFGDKYIYYDNKEKILKTISTDINNVNIDNFKIINKSNDQIIGLYNKVNTQIDKYLGFNDKKSMFYDKITKEHRKIIHTCFIKYEINK